jgi:hypothetical protein
MPFEILDHLPFVCYPREKPSVKTWKALEYDWEFWFAFVEWCLG